MNIRARLEHYFEFDKLQTGWRTEIVAGLTTFITMAYIIFVNPAILKDAGMPVGAVTAATCLCSGLASILMGVVARYPLALAPGMGLNAYFAYTVVTGLHVPWQVALAAVFLSGIIFLLLTATGFRRKIVEVIPSELYGGTAAGIGLFIAFVGLRNAGIVTASAATIVTLGNFRTPQTLLAVFGLLLTAVLLALRFRSAILLGIAATTAVAFLTGQIAWHPSSLNLGELSSTAFRLDLPGLWKLGIWEIVFVFLFVDLFDNLGTLVGVTRKAGFISATGTIPRVERVLFADAIGTVLGGLLGTSTITSYIESAAGIAAGGRSGITAVVTGLLFLVALFLTPLAGIVPTGATAPALILVGSLMMEHTREIEWNDSVQAVPAFLTIIGIPLTFSIATGLSFGFISAAALRILTGRFRRSEWLLYAIAAVCVARFAWLAQA